MDRHLSLNIKLLAVSGGKRGRLVYDIFVVLVLSAYKNGEWLDVGYWLLAIGASMIIPVQSLFVFSINNHLSKIIYQNVCL